MRKIIGVVFLILVGIFSLCTAQPTQIQANLSENETHVFVEIVNLDQKTVNGYVLLTLDEFSKIQNFSVPPKTSRVVISAKKPEKKGIAVAEIFLLDENQRQIVLTRETNPPENPPEKKENLPFFPLSQNYILIIIAVIAMIGVIGVFIVIKIKSQSPPGQW